MRQRRPRRCPDSLNHAPEAPGTLSGLLEHHVKGVVEVEPAHQGLMELAGNAVIQVVFRGVGAVAEILGISHHCKAAAAALFALPACHS